MPQGAIDSAGRMPARVQWDHENGPGCKPRESM